MPAELAGPLAVALDAAQEAAALIRAESHRSGGPRGYRAHADVDDEAELLIRSRLLAAFPEFGYRAVNSIAYRLALAAAGDATMATSIHGAGDWDYAGGQALLRAAGADLFDEDGHPATYSPQGQSRARACFGGAPGIVQVLLRRP